MRKYTAGIVVSVFSLIMVVTSTSCAESAKKKRGEHLLGKPAPSFSASSVNSGTQTLSAYKGKVVLLDFWATWCGPCRREMPAIKKIIQEYKGKDFVIIGISLDKDKQKLTKYMTENGIDWPTVFDGKGWKNRVAVQYDVHAIPFTVLIDRAGIVRKVGLRGKSLEDAISQMVSAKSGEE